MHQTLSKVLSPPRARSMLFLTLLLLAVLPALAGPDPSTPAGEPSPAAVDINTAGAAELVSLPGIGPALAQRIIAYRGEHGAFGRIEELLDVKGIGPKLLDKIRSRIRVGEKEASSSGKGKAGGRSKKGR